MGMYERSTVLDMLASGIPLSLLLDLALPSGPDSRAILRSEQRVAADSSGQSRVPAVGQHRPATA